MKSPLCVTALLLLLAPALVAKVSPRSYRGEVPAGPAPDGNHYLEAEEFKPASKDGSGWQAKTWGENYYAATFANSFLSRQAYLGAPAQANDAKASLQVEVAEDGKEIFIGGFSDLNTKLTKI